MQAPDFDLCYSLDYIERIKCFKGGGSLWKKSRKN